MEISTENVGTTPFLISGLQIEAIQTIVPLKPTTQKQSYKVQLPKSPLCGNFQRSFQIVIYHKVLEEANSGWIIAGWFKESLGKALVEEPIFSGRIKRLENCDDDMEYLEIITSDSGVRMVEANLEMITMDDFLDLKGKREDEVDLVFWEDINEENPQFSPLFFVQVTNFKCGGFSIGISCSLLVSDPLSFLSFISKWSDIHNNIFSQKIPLFYLPNLGKTAWSPPLKIQPCKGTKTSQTVIFKTETDNFDFEDGKMFKNLVAQCVDEVEHKLGKKLGMSNISLFLKEISGNIKIESFTKEEFDGQMKSETTSKFIFTNWDFLKDGEDYFSVGSDQTHASSWIHPVSPDEGFVMVMPSFSESNLRMTIMVSTPI